MKSNDRFGFKRLVYCYLPILLLILTTAASCSDDEGGHYPSLQTELVEAFTDANKNVKEIRLDNGVTFQVTQTISTNTADTLLRCVCSYAYDENAKKLDVYTISHIASALPITADTIDRSQSADYKLISSWATKRYINAYLSFQTTSQGTHRFLFLQDSIKTWDDGKKSVFVSLYHDRPAHDPESYTQKVYVSLPAYHYHAMADSVHLLIGGNTVTTMP